MRSEYIDSLGCTVSPFNVLVEIQLIIHFFLDLLFPSLAFSAVIEAKSLRECYHR